MKRSIISLLVLCLACTFSGFWPVQIAAQNSEPEVFLARIEGGIDSRAAAYAERVISEADDAGAAAVVLELNTPGGSLDATQEMVKTESNAEEVAVVSYVAPLGAQATSAGTFIVMASDVAAMAPQTRLGAAHPVWADGRDIMGTLGEKATNDAVALVTGLASAHGRNVEWAESSVRESVSVDAEEALELGVVEHVEPDLEAVLKAVDGERVEPKDITLQTSGATIIEKPMTFTERTSFFAYVLWILALLAVLFLAAAGFTYWRMRRWRVSTGLEGMVGEIGVVRQPVVEGMGGLVFVHGERWRAIPENAGSEPIRAGTEVEILGFRRGAVVVRVVEYHGSEDSS
jgi:membrane-bound ClpP family serine protease